MPSLPTDAANDNHDVREAALSSALAHLRRAVSATLPAAAFAEREGETLRAGASCCVVRRRCRHGLGVDLDHQHLAIIRGRRLQLEEGLRVRAEAQHRWLDDLRRGRVRKLTCSADASSSTLRTDDKSSCSRHSRSSASLTRVVVTSPFLVRLTGDILAIAGGRAVDQSLGKDKVVAPVDAGLKMAVYAHEGTVKDRIVQRELVTNEIRPHSSVNS